MKKVFAMLLALMLVLSLAAPAFAAEDTTTLKVDTTGFVDRTFDAYQIMTATNDGTNYHYSVDSAFTGILVDVLSIDTTDMDEEAVSDAIVTAVSELANDEAVLHFADELYRAILAATPVITPDVTNWNGAAKEVPQGYWLIVDVTPNLVNESNSLVMLDTAGDANVTVHLKADKTTSEKKVDDENDSIKVNISGNEDGENWQDSADYDIGDKVPFRITGQLVNDLTSYTYYSFKIVDTVDPGLTHLGNTATETNIELYVNGTKQTIKAAGTEGTANWVYEISGQTMTIYPNFGYTKNNGETVAASAAAGGDFLELFAEGTSHDEINSSTFTLLYNCLLNENAVAGAAGNENHAKAVVSNNPYGDGFGETPLDTTITFTYNFVVDKVDPNGQPLTGAQFSLYKFIAEGSGEYAGTETVYATAEEAVENNGYYVHPAANCYGKFEMVDRKTVNDEGTKFTFKGIDDGYYVLVETTVPDGYKGIAPVEFHVVATHVTDLTGTHETLLTELKAVVKGGTNQTISGDTATGTLTAVIENRTGAELPSTGGMGTTVFYILGSVLVMGALVMLITKKRMSVN